MKRFISLILALSLTLSLVSCGQSAPEAPAETPVELTVFAAASLTETLTAIADSYQSAHPGVTISFNFDSSGTLKTQIEEGADCDLFLSAGQPQMDALEEEELLSADSRVDLLENKVVLSVPDAPTKNSVTSFDDMAQKLQNHALFIAIGNNDVPVGQYTQQIFQHYGLDADALAAEGCITYGSNVKEVTTQVSEGSVDCGIIYATDAYSAGLSTVDSATVEMCGQVIYPAAVLKNAAYPKESQEFLDYLSSDEANQIFVEVGFSPLS